MSYIPGIIALIASRYYLDQLNARKHFTSKLVILMISVTVMSITVSLTSLARITLNPSIKREMMMQAEFGLVLAALFVLAAIILHLFWMLTHRKRNAKRKR